MQLSKHQLYASKTLPNFVCFRSSMILNMINDTQAILAPDTNILDETLTECLIQGTKSKKYIPLLKRQKCGKISRFTNNCMSHETCFRKFGISYGTMS